MKRISTCMVVWLSFSAMGWSQPVKKEPSAPRLVVGIMVDQMRWDYFYRFQSRYGENGLKRMLREGFACENTFIPYAQTVTAAGHACVYTGSSPAINGIMGNEWYERDLGRSVYCVEDASVKTIGGAPTAKPMSPRNLWTTTVTDELRLATNFRSKVLGIAIKDRGGILPAGHSANAAYWFDPASGNWVTSTYYMKELPAWATRFNERKVVDSMLRLDWNTLYPIGTYTQSDADDRPWEGRPNGVPKPTFPYTLSTLAGKNYGAISTTPQGSMLTLAFAKEAILAEEMGKDEVTDFLAVSLSSPDYIGHTFGPNSIEIEDTYLRLDRDLADFFEMLDKKVGKGNWLTFITADHAVAHVPGFLKNHKIPADVVSGNRTALENAVTARFGVKTPILDYDNYQLYLNYMSIDSMKVDRAAVRSFIVEELNKDPQILLAFDNTDISSANLPAAVRERFLQGSNRKRGGDIQVILKPHHFAGGATGTTHGSWYPYDSHIPLVFMGWGVRPGKTHREIYMTDIAPTLAAMLRIQMPSGSIGKVITEVIK